MKKLLLLLMMITASISAQEKFTIGGGGGILAVDGESGYNFNLFANYEVWEDIGVGVDGWYGDVEDTNILGAHLIGEFNGFDDFLGINDDLSFGAYLGPGIIQAEFDMIDESEGYFSFLSGVSIRYKMNANLRLGLRSGYHFTDDELGDVITGNLFLSYSF